MQAVKRWLITAAALGIASVLTMEPSSAVPTGGGLGVSGNEAPADPSQNVQGDTGNGNISAFAGVRFDQTKNGKGASTGPVTPVSDWTPPACWYAPKYDSEGAARDFLGYDRSPNHTGMDDAQQIRDHYINGHPYTNFNLDKQGKGYWWAAFYDDTRLTDPGSDECTEQPFWVDKGAPPPPVKNAVTPEILAQLAYAQIRIPQGKASINPDGTQIVNVPTWVWMDRTTFHPVSVRAYVAEIGIEATTTATPVGLHIDPGTQDATLFPPSGDCTIDADGNIGAPYVAGDDGNNPPCGVTYLRSTQSTGPYRLKATVTWRISWTGTGQPTPVALPNGTFGMPQDTFVREYQTVNR